MQPMEKICFYFPFRGLILL